VWRGRMGRLGRVALEIQQRKSFVSWSRPIGIYRGRSLVVWQGRGAKRTVNDDQIVDKLRRIAADGARPVEIAAVLGELVGGLTTDAFLFYVRRAFPGIPPDILFNRTTAWSSLGASDAAFLLSDHDLNDVLAPWISGKLEFNVLTLEVTRADPDGDGELLADGRFRVVPAAGSLEGGDEFSIVVADGITMAVFRRAPLPTMRPRWIDACVFIENLQEDEAQVTFDIHIDGAVTTALASFGAALATSRLREGPTIAKDSDRREYTVSLRATPGFEFGWRGSVEWEAE